MRRLLLILPLALTACQCVPDSSAPVQPHYAPELRDKAIDSSLLEPCAPLPPLKSGNEADIIEWTKAVKIANEKCSQRLSSLQKTVKTSSK